MNTDQHGLGTGLLGCWIVAARRKVTRAIFLLAGLSVIFSSKATAQMLPPDDFFHAGAMAYLSNNIPAALERVTNGLAIYPNDEKLQKLEQLLKQQQQQQQQQNQDQQQNQQQKDQSKQDQQKNQNQNQQQGKDKSDQEKQKEEQQKKDQQKQDQKDQKQADQQQVKKSDEQKEKPEEQQAVAAGQMTPQEAKQLLDAQKNDEVMLPVSRADKPKNRSAPLKDW